jgi:hypothetical protein
VLLALAGQAAGQEPAGPEPQRDGERIARARQVYGELQDAINPQMATWSAFSSLDERRRVMATFAPKFEAAASQFAGSDAEVMFLTWLVLHAGDASARAALGRLLGTHLRSNELPPFVPTLVERAPALLGVEEADRLRQRLLADGPAEVKAWLLLSEAYRIVQGSPGDAEALALLKEARKLGSSLRFKQLLRDTTAAASRVTRSLEAGALAPDFRAEDVAGKDLALHDYRGRVVLVRLWDLPPPSTTEMQQTIAGLRTRAFAVIDVSHCRMFGRLLRFARLEGTSRAVWDFPAAPPDRIATSWGLRSFPASILIDHGGRVVGRVDRSHAWSSSAEDQPAAYVTLIERLVVEAERAAPPAAGAPADQREREGP